MRRTSRILAVPTLLAAVFAVANLSEAGSEERTPRPRNHRITLEEAVTIVGLHGERHPDTIHAGMFHRAIFDQILAQTGSAGIRVYYAERINGDPTLVLVGVDAKGNDLDKGIIGDYSSPCPSYCGANPSLGDQ